MGRISHKISQERIKQLQSNLEDGAYIDKAVRSLASVLTREMCDGTDATKRTIKKHIDKKAQQKHSSQAP